MLQAFNDKKFIEDNIEYMEKEFLFWRTNRTKEITVGDKTFKLSRYNVEVDDPRPGDNLHSLLLLSIIQIESIITNVKDTAVALRIPTVTK